MNKRRMMSEKLNRIRKKSDEGEESGNGEDEKEKI